MSTVKEQFIKLIEDQPEDSSSEEIIREMAFAAMVDKGIADSDGGCGISVAQERQTVEQWNEPDAGNGQRRPLQVIRVFSRPTGRQVAWASKNAAVDSNHGQPHIPRADHGGAA